MQVLFGSAHSRLWTSHWQLGKSRDRKWLKNLSGWEAPLEIDEYPTDSAEAWAFFQRAGQEHGQLSAIEFLDHRAAQKNSGDARRMC